MPLQPLNRTGRMPLQPLNRTGRMLLQPLNRTGRMPLQSLNRTGRMPLEPLHVHSHSDKIDTTVDAMIDRASRPPWGPFNGSPKRVSRGSAPLRTALRVCWRLASPTGPDPKTGTAKDDAPDGVQAVRGIWATTNLYLGDTVPELYLTTAIGGTTCRTAGTPSTITAAAPKRRRAAAAPAGDTAPTRPQASPQGLGTFAATVRQVPAAGPVVDQETGEILAPEKRAKGTRKTPDEVRRTKYRRQRSIAAAISDKEVASCGRTMLGSEAAVQSKTVAAVRGLFFSGLRTCGKAWLCPCCQSKLSTRRATEAQKAVDAHKANGGETLLTTFTLSHARSDALASTLGALKDAMRRMKRHRSHAAAMKVAGLVGSIIATEITHGGNGWHPHMHVLMFVADGADRVALKAALDKAWQSALAASGYTASDARGVRVDGGDQAAAYVSKMADGAGAWTLANEIAQTGAKVGRKGSRAVWELVDALADPDAKVRATAQALLCEYAAATHKLRALTWSPGLKKHFAVADKTDDELLAEADTETSTICTINRSDWWLVCRNDARADVLAAAESAGAAGVAALLALLRHQDRTHIEATDDMPELVH
jgi:hypothetical protein